MNLKTWVISKAYYDGTGGVGKSKLMEQFPHALGPLAFYDNLTNLAKPWGRDPATGDPLIVTEVDRFTSTVVTPGVMSSSDRLTPADGSVPTACVTSNRVYDSDVATAIHAHVEHLVLAFETYDGEDPPIEGWGPDDGFTSPQWTTMRDFLVSLDAPADDLDQWRTNHPNATRREFYDALDGFIERQE